MTASAPSAAAAAVVILTLTLTLVSDVSGFPSRHLDPSAVDDTRLGKEMNTLSERLNRLATQLQAQLAETTDLQLLLGSVTKSVAFTVTFSSPEVHGLNKQQTLQFDSVLHNIGNGYSPETGVFTAPEPGTYVFYIHVTRHPSDPERCLAVDLNHGQQQVTSASSCLSEDDDSSSSMAALHLAVGDTVRVKLRSGTMLIGYLHTSMSGRRL